jgi:hypothetical protein
MYSRLEVGMKASHRKETRMLQNVTEVSDFNYPTVSFG